MSTRLAAGLLKLRSSGTRFVRSKRMEHELGNGPTMQLARWIANLSWRDLPGRTKDVARLALFDTVGCGVYGFETPWTQTLLKWAEAGGARGGSRVWSAEQPRLRAADAALVNGTAAHAFELDDYHNAKLHPGAVVIPAALALAEALDASAERLVTAIAAGYEVMIRSSLALEPSAARLRGWHLTGACGPFGAAAAGAVLLGLDAERTAWALGLAGTQGAGLWAFNADGAMSKRLHAGKAAHSGVLSAELAHAGFSGPTQIYEAHDGGFLKAFSDASDPAPLTHALGSKYHLDTVSIKPYSCCGSTHAYIDAALELRRRLGEPWDPARPVRVGTSKVVDVQCGFDYVPSTALNAQMSLRYCVAAALMDGQVLPAQFSAGKMQDPALGALAGRLELEEDPALDKLYPAHFAGWVAAKAGEEWMRVDILDPTGSTAAPVDAEAARCKFRANNPDLPVDRIAAVALDIEHHCASQLIDLLVPLRGERAVA
ncbi:MAG: MmgE/PrpD family protein [Betaproteobacteria bacterium]|nr:MAG: MmgE/PrpD family protein [Betaproteobacteria bacterium]